MIIILQSSIFFRRMKLLLKKVQIHNFKEKDNKSSELNEIRTQNPVEVSKINEKFEYYVLQNF